MSNVLTEEKRQQVIALRRLGWPLRRIEQETGVRWETASAYLKAAGIGVRPPRACGRRPPAKLIGKERRLQRSGRYFGRGPRPTGLREAFMMIVGCDFHPAWQQIAVLDSETGEITEPKLMHGNGEAEPFYRRLPAPSFMGMEAWGNSQWLVARLPRLGHEVWIGDAAQIRAS